MATLIKREKDGNIITDTFSDGFVFVYPINPLFEVDEPKGSFRWVKLDYSSDSIKNSERYLYKSADFNFKNEEE